MQTPNGMSMTTAVADQTENAETVSHLSPVSEIDNGAVVISMNMTAATASADRTGLQFRLKYSHVGIKDKFR